MSPDPNRDHFGGGLLWRSLTPAQCRAIAEQYATGVSAPALAGMYSVSRRTVYRALGYARQPWTVVTVGDWCAEFVLTPDGPVRCTSWMAVA